jgi:ATP synthase protein I
MTSGPPTDGDRSDGDADRRRAGHRVIVAKSRRRELARRRPRSTVGRWVGSFGLVGWTVTVPTLLGLALGAFLDDRFGGRLRFTVTFLLLGVAAGSATAWHWLRRELDDDLDEGGRFDRATPGEGGGMGDRHRTGGS